MQAYKHYFRRISRKTKFTAKDVEQMWKDEMKNMLDEGIDKNRIEFLQLLNERVLEHLEVKSDYLHLDKFKKFLK